VQLGLAHRALEAEQQPIVEVRGVVDPILVEDEGIGQGTDLEQPVPVGRVASQPRDLQPEHDPGAPQADIGDEPLKSFAVDGGGTGLPKVGINDDDVVVGPAECDRALAKRVLALGALGVVGNLSTTALPHVEVRIAPQMTGGDFLMSLGGHGLTSPRPRLANTMLASPRTMPARRSSGHRLETASCRRPSSRTDLRESRSSNGLAAMPGVRANHGRRLDLHPIGVGD